MVAQFKLKEIVKMKQQNMKFASIVPMGLLACVGAVALMAGCGGGGGGNGNSGGGGAGNVYMQTNGLENEIVHYARLRNGQLSELERIATGGKGSGTYKPIYDKPSEPNPFEGVGSVILTPDHRILFTTNGGDNSVSSFAIGDGGNLTLMDVKATGQPVRGKSGTAKTLAYAPRTQTLYVGHSFGPDHIHVFSVKDGKLTLRQGSASVNTPAKTDRVMTQIVLTPDGNFLMGLLLFDHEPKISHGGDPVAADVAVSNVEDKDGLVVFPVKDNGDLGEARIMDAGGAAGFSAQFLHGSNDTFVTTYAGGNGLAMGKISASGTVTHSPIVAIDVSKGKPSEQCWLAITPDNKQVLATSFGYSTVSSYKIADGELQIAKDPAAPAVPGDGTFKALDGLVSSGPNDSLISPDGKYFYQIYPNASKLISYQLGSDGALKKIDEEAIPYTSPQGLAGF